jgi:bacillithiol biosynthesis cysteine-adding enzyme BshC
MKSSCIDYQETGSFSPVIIDYLEQDPKLAPFINFPATIEGFKLLIEQRIANKINVNRDVLVTALKEQYSNIPASDKVNQNIELLSKENTYTITTGHQLNIFTGPLYFIFKIVSSINLANDLKKALPEYNFVPVYWMATEDHDFAEINHTYLEGRKLSWDIPAAGATGRLNTESIAHIVKEYQNTLGASVNAEKLSRIVEQAYGFPLLADATRYLADALFGEYGLVIVDADNKELKQTFAPVIERDIIDQNSFREINNSSEKLKMAGYHPGVNAREINFFYLDEGLRERIVYKEGRYHILNTGLNFSEEEIRKEIHNNPEKFSPNVVLRPLYQEIILPNLAYIGGGSEVAYWLQLKQNFDFYGVNFPVLILRNSALIADEVIESKLRKANLSFKDIFKGLDNLKKEWILSHSEHDLTLKNEWEELQTTFEKIKQRSSKIDPTLAPSAEAVSARLHKALLNLEKKLVRAEKRNYSTALSQIEKIKAQLFPGGTLQERKENFGSLYVTYGEDFIPELIRHFKPLDFKFTILY